MITWLASYPRSGNTFLRIILNKVFGIQTYSIYNDLKDIEAHRETKEIVGHLLLPKDFNFEKASISELEYYIKTHRHPASSSDKVIYLVRDGRDSITSYYHYRNEYNNAPPLSDFIEGKTRVGAWSDHIEKWTSINKDKLLLIRFEELINTNPVLIGKISEFIGKLPTESTLPGFQELNKMNPKFFKSGKSRTYKELFSEQDHLYFWSLHHKSMLKLGYKSDLPDSFENLLPGI